MEVTNAAAVDVNPVLTISEQTGVVIAKQEQSRAIAAGTSGTASWFLRAADEGAGGGSGIQFDTDPQTGDWLLVTTTGTNPSTFDGIDLVASGDIVAHSDNRITLEGTNQVDLESSLVNASADVFLVSSDDIELTGGGGFGFLLDVEKVQIVSGSDTNISADDNMNLGGDLLTFIRTAHGDTVIRIGTSHNVNVLDPSGNKVFQIDADGSLHGKTGKSLVFDL